MRRTDRYDLAADPHEQHPLDATDPTGAPLVSRLQSTTAWGDAHRSAAVRRADRPGAAEKRLKALGYLE
jgi:hypothetical protein